MIDWTSSMKQTFEYYTVDPGTWKDLSKLTNVTSCTIDRDDESITRGSATIDVNDLFGESYIRAYLVAEQNGEVQRHPLGTYLVQTPSSNFDGKKQSVSMDAYTPLIELKESMPPIGYYLPKGSNILQNTFIQARNHMRAPISETISDKELHDNFVADPDESWIDFLSELLKKANYRFDIDEIGRILLAPIQPIESLQPTWTYTDDNSSILLPDFSIEHDLYGVPNVVEVIYTNGTDVYFATVKNEDPNSPTSIPSRGREIVYRDTNPSLVGIPTNHEVEDYARRLLKTLSSIEYSVSYTHGYCPVRVGDCVRLSYKRAGLNNVKAVVTKQSISCTPGCPVSETAVFTNKLWG